MLVESKAQYERAKSKKPPPPRPKTKPWAHKWKSRCQLVAPMLLLCCPLWPTQPTSLRWCRSEPPATTPHTHTQVHPRTRAAHPHTHSIRKADHLPAFTHAPTHPRAHTLARVRLQHNASSSSLDTTPHSLSASSSYAAKTLATAFHTASAAGLDG